MRNRLAAWLGTAVFASAAWAGTAVAQQQSPPQQAPPTPPPAQTQSQPTPPAKPDSLAEAARKAKAAKAKSKDKPGKSYTEDDLAGLKGTGISVVGQETSAEAKEKEADAQPEAAEAADPGKGEAYWRGKARKILDQIAAVDREIAKVKEDIKKSGSITWDTTSGLKDAVIYYEDRNAKVKALEKRKEDLQKQMEQLMEEGRRAGADPGWFR